MKDLKSVIIIGGGIVGASVAYFLSQEGIRVNLFERDECACGTTARNTGVLDLVSRTPDQQMAIALESRRLYEVLLKILPRPFLFEERGSIMVLAEGTEGTPSQLEACVRGIKALGVGAELLEPAEVRRRVPELSVETLGGLFCPIGTLVGAEAAARALLEGATRAGALIREREPVQKLLTEGGRIKGVKTEKGEYEADGVVLAAGVWSPRVTEGLGLEVPILPRRGQVLVTEEIGPVSQYLIWSADYILQKLRGGQEKTSVGGKPEIQCDETTLPGFLHSFSFQQHPGGSCYLGSTREFAGFEETVTDRGREAILQSARRWFPILSNVSLARSFAGLRPWTPDHRPLIGPSARVEGLWYATGHEGDGVTLAPITGKIIAELIRGKTPEFPGVDLSCYLPARMDL